MLSDSTACIFLISENGTCNQCVPGFVIVVSDTRPRTHTSKTHGHGHGLRHLVTDSVSDTRSWDIWSRTHGLGQLATTPPADSPPVKRARYRVAPWGQAHYCCNDFTSVVFNHVIRPHAFPGTGLPYNIIVGREVSRPDMICNIMCEIR